jgi:hypothetical protein
MKWFILKPGELVTTASFPTLGGAISHTPHGEKDDKRTFTRLADGHYMTAGGFDIMREDVARGEGIKWEDGRAL